MEVDIINPLVNGQSCEEFNNYVTPDVNVTQQQPCSVVQSPNRSSSISNDNKFYIKTKENS